MEKMQFALLGGAAIVFVILLLLIGALGLVGYLYFKSNPDTGNFNYTTYNESTDVSITPTPTASPTATPTPTATPSPTPTPSASPTPTPSPSPSPSPTASNCPTYEGANAIGAKVCGGKDADPAKKYVWECLTNGSWGYIETCTSTSACNNGVCS